MINDDDKRMDSEGTSDQKLADVIDFNEAREKKDAEGKANDDSTAEPVSLGETIAGIKEMIANIRAQMEPVRHTISDFIDASKAGAASARERMGLEDGEDAHAADKKDEAKPEDADAQVKNIIEDGIARAKQAMTPDPEEIRQTSEVINLAYERLKRQGIEKKIDLQMLIQKQFEDYADKNLTDKDYTVDENGKRVVKLDARFIKEHGMDAVPALLGGIANSVVGTLFGDILGINPDAADNASESEASPEDDTSNQNAAPADAADHEASAEADSSNTKPGYRVQFDFAKLLGEALKTAKISSVRSAQTGEVVEVDEKASAAAREIAVKGAQVMEDVLNGKEPDEALSKIDGMNSEPGHTPSSLTPEEITPVDETHQRILDLAKAYDQALKGEDDEEEET